MNVMNLKTIKWESVKSIFNAIAGTEQISRAQISEITGLSLVTVGKVADALLDMNIVNQEKQIKATAGRRAGLLAINRDKFVLNLDLSSKVFRFSVINLKLELQEKTRHTYDNDRFYEENLHSFLAETVQHMTKGYNMEDCFGIGVSLPGRYNPQNDTIIAARIPEIAPLHIRSIVEKHFSGYPIFLEASENVAALSNISTISEYMDKNILYWFLGEETTTGALLVNGSFIHGNRQQPCDFGHIVLPDGTLLGNALRGCQTPEDITGVIAYSLHNIIQIIAPDTIILECEHLQQYPEARDRVVPLVQEVLCEEYHYSREMLPDIMITCCKFRHAHRGLSMRLREMWIDKILLQN